MFYWDETLNQLLEESKWVIMQKIEDSQDIQNPMGYLFPHKFESCLLHYVK